LINDEINLNTISIEFKTDITFQGNLCDEYDEVILKFLKTKDWKLFMISEFINDAYKNYKAQLKSSNI
jgi:hypothetical protein